MAVIRRNKARLYKDFDLDFGKNAVTGDLDKLLDVKAVKQAMQNLIMTRPFERFFHPELGSNLMNSLFEPMTVFTSASIETQIKQLFFNYEPRVDINAVYCEPMYDQNEYKVEIRFNIVGINEPQELQLTLERLR